ncbi:MAG: hypothetical protein WAM30_21420 [Candidatus Dormiibacterota bacterium]
MAATDALPGSPARPGRALQRSLTGVALLLLVAQFLFGIVVNLFVSIPTHHPGAQASEYFGGVVRSVSWAVTGSGLVWLQVHAALGLLLVLFAVLLLVVAIVSRRGGRITAAALGLFGVLGAGFNGGSFLNYNEDFSSMLMAGGFALAVAAYVVGLLIEG